MSGLPRHPFVLAVKPVVEALGATLVPADEREPGDMPLRWEGSIIAAVRMAPLHGALDRLIDAVEREFGAPLAVAGTRRQATGHPAARRARRVHLAACGRRRRRRDGRQPHHRLQLPQRLAPMTEFTG